MKQQRHTDCKVSHQHRPPQFRGIEWVQRGAGWDCRLSLRLEGGKRRRHYLGHLGAARWHELRETYTAKGLRQFLETWIEERKVSKMTEADAIAEKCGEN